MVDPGALALQLIGDRSGRLGAMARVRPGFGGQVVLAHELSHRGTLYGRPGAVEITETLTLLPAAMAY